MSSVEYAVFFETSVRRMFLIDPFTMGSGNNSAMVIGWGEQDPHLFTDQEEAQKVIKALQPGNPFKIQIKPWNSVSSRD